MRKKFIQISIEMVKHGDTLSSLAKAIHIAQDTLSRRLKGVTQFKQKEIERICKRYGKTYEDLFCIAENTPQDGE